MADFAAQCRNLLERADRAGWSLVSERAIPYGRLFVLAAGGPLTATLSCYHGRKGFKFVLGGKRAGDLGALLGAAPPKRPDAAESPEDPFGLGLPRVGADESGKGDFFGPLVVAAWLLDEGEGETLRGLKVADSKALSDPTIERIAGRLEALGRGVVRTLMPREYNPHYARTRNLNLLLAEMHGACIRSLLQRETASPRVVVVDQFASDPAPLRRALALPTGCRLVTRTRGEADPAVAAASLLARAAFVNGLRELSHEFGHTFPAGAGAPVLAAARSFVRTFGAERLEDVAKVHFATTRKL